MNADCIEYKRSKQCICDNGYEGNGLTCTGKHVSWKSIEIVPVFDKKIFIYEKYWKEYYVKLSNESASE